MSTGHGKADQVGSWGHAGGDIWYIVYTMYDLTDAVQQKWPQNLDYSHSELASFRPQLARGLSLTDTTWNTSLA